MPLRRAAHPQPAAGEGQLQAHRRSDIRTGLVAAQSAGLLAGPRHPAEERVGDRVEYRGLARAGLAMQQKQPISAQPVQIDALGSGERPQRGHLEPVQPHPARSCLTRVADRASANSARSTVVGFELRTHSTKSAAVDRSS